MKKIIVLLALITLVFSVYAATKAPNFTLKNMKNKNVSLEQYLEKGIVIVDFWASWCAPCKKSMPHLEELHKKYDNVNVITISIDKPKTMNKAKSYLRQQKFTFESLFDPNSKVAKSFGVKNVPRSFIIAPDGTILLDHNGYKAGDEKHMEEIIKNWIQENSNK